MVSPYSPPYLQPGYAAVILYGPALIALACGGWEPTAWWAVAVYEVIALAATLIYARFGNHLDLFPPEPRAQLSAKLAGA